MSKWPNIPQWAITDTSTSTPTTRTFNDFPELLDSLRRTGSASIPAHEPKPGYQGYHFGDDDQSSPIVEDPPRPPELCHLCKGINAGALASEYGYIHASSLDMLSTAEHENCPFCSSILESTLYGTEEELQELRKPGHAITMKLVQDPKSEVNTSAIHYLIGDKENHGYAVRCFEGDDAARFGIATVHKLDYIGSPSSMTTAHTWFIDCQNTHDCGTIFPLVRDLVHDYPSRLLKLQYLRPGDKFIAKLVQFTTKPLEPYAALSYCWGKPVEARFSLTTATEQELSSSIRIDTLPKTIYDAMVICTYLGLHYIWVDSLCIIQDSKEDWQKESKKMGGIYAGCAITIAADSADNSSGGCFNQKSWSRLVDEQIHMPITTKTRSGEDSTLLLDLSSSGHGTAISAIEDSPLMTRGWTYQERILPPRILHCTKDQLYWECRHSFKAEDGVVIVPGKQNRTTPSFIKNMADFKTTHALASPSQIADRNLAARLALGFWYAEVVSRKYSYRSLTYSSDKLPAISGIARALGNIWKGKYMCGMWDLMLPEALLFARKIGNKEPSTPQRNEAYRCPSWSWAAYDFPVDWYNGVAQKTTRDMISVTSISIAPVDGGDRYGEIREANIQVSGSVIAFALQRRPAPNPFPRSRWLMNHLNQPIGWCDLDFDYTALQEVYALLCVVRETPNGHAGGVLCLKRSEKTPRAFERVGSGILGANAPGTFQMVGVKEAAERELHDLVKKRHDLVTLV